jgi:hypothetical protein
MVVECHPERTAILSALRLLRGVLVLCYVRFDEWVYEWTFSRRRYFLRAGFAFCGCFPSPSDLAPTEKLTVEFQRILNACQCRKHDEG